MKWRGDCGRNGARRTRRAGAWPMPLALLVGFLCLLGLVLAIGVVAMRQSRISAAEATLARDELRAARVDVLNGLARQAEEVVALSARLDTFTDECGRAVGMLQQKEANRIRDSEVMKSDMVRFSAWMEEEEARITRALAEMKGRIETMGRIASAQEKMPGQGSLPPSRSAEVVFATAAAANAGGAAVGTPPVGPTQAAVAAMVVEEEEFPVSAAALQVEMLSDKPKPTKVVLHLPGGEVYEGEATDGLPNGQGTCIYANGSRYAGTFKRGKKHGRGVFTFANGDTYAGDYVEDVREGQGIYTYRDGSRYEGGFRNGSRNGKGQYSYKGGGEYTGEFKDGRRHGWGTHVFPDGSRMEGQWQNDQFLGAAPR